MLDDATKPLLYAQLSPEETSHAFLIALRPCWRAAGCPSPCTPTGRSAFHTPTPGGLVDRTHLTVVGPILARFGIQHIPRYSPQARGRVERLNRTLQRRLVNELRVAAVTTLEAANAYLREQFIADYNREFTRPPAYLASAFLPLGAALHLDQLLGSIAIRRVRAPRRPA